MVLKVGGNAFSGWTSVIVEKSMGQMAGSFGLATTDTFPGEARKWDIAMGDECIVEINGQKIITGHVEDILIDYDTETHNIQFGGRDKTGDLVDCSFDGTIKEWKGLSVKQVIEKLCEPFDIEVVVDNSVSTVANVVWPGNMKANEGDTVFDLVLKICQTKAILPISYGDGKLTLTQAGKDYQAYDNLVSGVNILKGGLDQSDKDRFRTYIVKGQGVGGDSLSSLFDFTGPAGRATDNIIGRYRPIILFTETPTDKGRCLE
ncbi:MAG TPA: hypothetical protein ENH82_09480, partial [bacterium]|nr:hypothetical protein [bacterium]